MNTARKLELFLLKEGETLEAKAVELIKRCVGIADMKAIRVWIGENPDIRKRGPIVIADPFADIRPVDSDPPLAYVPCHSIDDKGIVRFDGLIDLAVPMWPARAGGQLAILGIHEIV
ncbi:MAG TPA: hypothetical protein VFQ72_01845 [Candidatus Paceibacterota bacterium]|nr:hypothetical protein [Candidatus Paceibacterota bacterium]